MTDRDEELRDRTFEPGTDHRPDDAIVELEVDDVLDLHAFPPSEIGDLVKHYLELASEKGLTRVRIIHGKGIGTQRRRVRSILEADPRVTEWGDAGSWGATWAKLGS